MRAVTTNLSAIFRRANRAGILAFRVCAADWVLEPNAFRAALIRRGVNSTTPFVCEFRPPGETKRSKGVAHISHRDGAGARLVALLDQIGVEWDWDGSEHCGIAIPFDPASYCWRYLAFRSAHKRAALIARFGTIMEAKPRF